MTWLRRHMLHCINLSGPHTGKVIFYCVCQSLINPCTSSILVRKKRGGGRRYRSILQFSSSHSFSSQCSVFILFVFIPSFSPCQPSAYLPIHPPHTNTHHIFFFSAPHEGPNIFPWGAHFSQTVMNGSGSCIDFQTETI